MPFAYPVYVVWGAIFCSALSTAAYFLPAPYNAGAYFLVFLMVMARFILVRPNTVPVPTVDGAAPTANPSPFTAADILALIIVMVVIGAQATNVRFPQGSRPSPPHATVRYIPAEAAPANSLYAAIDFRAHQYQHDYLPPALRPLPGTAFKPIKSFTSIHLVEGDMLNVAANDRDLAPHLRQFVDCPEFDSPGTQDRTSRQGYFAVNDFVGVLAFTYDFGGVPFPVLVSTTGSCIVIFDSDTIASMQLAIVNFGAVEGHLPLTNVNEHSDGHAFLVATLPSMEVLRQRRLNTLMLQRQIHQQLLLEGMVDIIERHGGEVIGAEVAAMLNRIGVSIE